MYYLTPRHTPIAPTRYNRVQQRPAWPVSSTLADSVLADSTLADSILIVAGRELAAGCKETVNREQRIQNNNPCANRYNGFVWPLWEVTRSEYSPSIGAAYCASFVCFVVYEASRLAGCTETRLIVTASVQGLGIWAEAMGVLRPNTYQAKPGDVFLRNRWRDGTRQSDGSTWRNEGRGHCGIITEVTGNQVRTIEANGIYRADGGAEAVHTQTYSIEEITNAANGFAFIPSDALADCPKAQEPQEQENTDGGSMIIQSDDPSNTSTRRAQRPGTTPCTPAMTEVKLDGVGEAALHYDNLRNPLVASDIVGANNTELVTGGNWSKRNGAALGFEQVEFSNDSSAFTGFGVLTDRAGNTYVITVEGITNSDRIVEKLLDTSICTKIPVNYIPGNAPKLLKYGWSLTGDIEVAWAENNSYRSEVNGQNTDDLKGLSIGRTSIFDQLWEFSSERVMQDGQFRQRFKALPLMEKNGNGLFKAIETICTRTGKRLDKIVWLHYAAEPPRTNWLDVLTTVLDTLTAFAPGLGIAKDVWRGASQGIKGIRSGNILDSIQGIGAVVGAISPETLRNINNLTDEAKAVIRKVEAEIKTVVWNFESSYEQIISPVVRGAGSILAGIEDTMQIQKVAKTLGIDAAELNALRQRFRTFNPQTVYTPDFVTKITGKYVDYAPILQSLNTAVMVDSLRTQLKTIGGSDSNISWLKTQLLGMYGGKIEQVPIMQELFSTGMAGTLLPSVPGFSDIVASVLTDASARAHALGDITGPAFAHKFKNWLGSAFGYKMGENILADITLRSLTEQANQYAYNKLKDFPLPLSIPEKYRAAFAQEIAQAMQGDIRVHCSDGMIFDIASCRCIPATNGQSSTPPEKRYIEFPNPGSETPSPDQSDDDTPDTGGPSSRRDCCPNTNTQSVVVNNYIVTREEKKKTEQRTEAPSSEKALSEKAPCPPGTYKSGDLCLPLPFTDTRTGYQQFCSTCSSGVPSNAASSVAPVQFPSSIKLELPDLSKLVQLQLPPINVTLPNITLPSITLPKIEVQNNGQTNNGQTNNGQANSGQTTVPTADSIKVDVHVPPQQPPIVNVQVPQPVIETKAPIVQMQMPELPAPIVNVATPAPVIHLPQQPAPTVNVATAPAVINVPEQPAPSVYVQPTTPTVKVETPAPIIQMPNLPVPIVNVATAPAVINVPKQPAPNVYVQPTTPTVHVENAAPIISIPKQPAPNVYVQNTPPTVHVETPAPIINIPKQPTPSVYVQQTAPRVQVTPHVHVQPKLTVQLPKQAPSILPAPVVNVDVTPPPSIEMRPVINLPQTLVQVKQPAPVVNVHNQAPQPTVLPAPVVNVKQPAPVVHVHNQAPQPAVLPAPVVNVALPEQRLPEHHIQVNPVINIPERQSTVNVPVHVNVPERQTKLTIPVTIPERQNRIQVNAPITVPERQQHTNIYAPVTVPERQAHVTVNTPVTVPERSTNITVPVAVPERTNNVYVHVPERQQNVTVNTPVTVPERQTTIHTPTTVSMHEAPTTVSVQNTMPEQRNTYYNVVRPVMVQRNYQSNPQSNTQHVQQRGEQNATHRTGVANLPRTYQYAPSGGYYRDTKSPDSQSPQAETVAPVGSTPPGTQQGTTQGTTTQGGNPQPGSRRLAGGYYRRDVPPSGLAPPVSRQQQPTAPSNSDEDCEEIELTLTGLRQRAQQKQRHQEFR